MKKIFEKCLTALALLVILPISSKADEKNVASYSENEIFYENSQDNVNDFFKKAREETENKVKELNEFQPYDQYSYEYKTVYMPRKKVYKKIYF